MMLQCRCTVAVLGLFIFCGGFPSRGPSGSNIPDTLLRIPQQSHNVFSSLTNMTWNQAQDKDRHDKDHNDCFNNMNAHCSMSTCYSIEQQDYPRSLHTYTYSALQSRRSSMYNS
ncbi:hypothetical protein DFH05DRAFT_1001875 [Lentinula detonsa]|uniref:Uncharacterized protein n=1 Tax=Lentinula detonsa TaxID=2804962 RepID=A0A9W8P2B0_9AGAR|nr:hypothetical protein DFH05DRAFT_1001875 [Lentinula detonsa]